MFERLIETAQNKMSRKSNQEKERLKLKYQSLIRNNPQEQVNERAVVNLSDKTLTINEKKVLAKGLNFALDHSEKDKLQFIAQVETAVEDIKNVNA